jgi:enhancing lycopene biosynthesis protein 2
MKYIKKQILHERKIQDRQLVINADGSIELNPLNGNVTVNGNLRVTGSSSGPTNSLTYYVSLEGDDRNDGLGAGPDRAKRTVKAAVEAAPPGATIQIAPGDYFENNPITLKERQTVRGTSLRNTQIYPLNNTLDIFFVDNACYLFQLTFRGLRDPGWCVRIKPGALVTVSPYVQNCTNMNGPWLNDGTEFIPFETVQIEGIQPGARPIINNENVPFGKRVNETGGGNGMLVDGNEYDQRSLVFSMVADAFTQIAQGGIGFHITNFGYTQIVSCFSVFTRIGFLATKGGYLSISNSVSDFGTFAIIADGVFDIPYTTARPVEDYFSTVGSITVTNPGFGYTSPPVVEIDPPGDSSGVQAQATASIDPVSGQVTSVRIDNPGSGYDFIPQVQFIGGGFSQPASAVANLITNRSIEVNSLRDRAQVGSIITFEGDNTKYYITEAESLREPFIYDETICRRDVRRIVDAVVGDMVMGTNYQALAAGRSYLRSTAGLVLQQQLTPTIFGIEAARDEMLDRITGNDPVDIEARNRITESFAIITNILEQGDSTAAPDIIYNDLATIDQGVIDAKDNIVANRDFIIEEITKYIQQQFTDLSYNQEKCERDVRLVMTAVAFDVSLGTNYNSVTSGLAYQRANAITVQQKQKIQTIDAFTFVKNNVAQFGSVAGDATALQRSNAGFDEIIDIINDETPSSLTFPNPIGASQNRINAKNQLILNRTFIQAEIIAWIQNEIANAELGSIWFNFTYNEAACERDIGLIVDALTYDIIYGGNTATRTAAEAYFVGALSQLGSAAEAPATVLAYRHLQGVVTQLVQGGQIIPTPGNNEIQDTSAGNAGPTEADTLSNLIEIVIGVIQAGNTNNIVEAVFPSISWTTTALQNATNTILAQRDNQAIAVTNYILQTYPEFTYDRTKCRRDVGLIIDAVARDVRLNTNHNSIVAGLAYRRQSANVVDARQLPATILALREAQRLSELAVIGNTVTRTRVTARYEELLHIIEFGELPQGVVQFFNVPPIAGADLINAQRQLQENRAFLTAETIAYINNEVNTALPGSIWDGFVYDQTLCARDVGFIVDAVTHDLLYGGNRSILIATRAYFDANIAQLPVDQVEPTAQAIEHLRDVASQVIRAEIVIKSPGNTEDQVTTTGPGTVTESNLSESLFNILINGIRGGLITTPAQVNPNFTWVTAAIQEAVANLLLEDFNIRDGVIDFITNKIIGFSYNIEKCERDTGYIVDAAVYDMMYGGNKQTRRAGEAYYNNVVIRGQEAVTEFSYKRLAEVLDLIAQDIAVTPSEGVVQTQTISGTPGSSAAGETISDRVLTIADVVRFGIAVLPTEVDHDYDNLGDVDLNVRRNVILDDLQAIEDESIRLLNLEFGGEARLTIFPGLVSVLEGTLATLVNVSTVSTSGHAFEYVGAGITYNALPFFGGSPIAENEVVESNDGKVFAGGTVDQIGNFRVGNFFNVNALDGSITLNAEQINLQGLSSIGPFRRDGIPVGVELREVSDSTDLISSIGVSDTNTAPTQNAVVQYVENRYFNKNTGSTVLGPSIFQDDVQFNGDLETTLSTFNLINDNANTVNFASGASVINIGDEIGTTTIRNSLLVGGDLDISGGNSSSIAGNLFITVNENVVEAFTIKKDAADSSVVDYITIGTINTSESVVFGEEPQIAILNQTESINKNSGALTVDGGVGIAKNLNIGGNVLMEGDTFSTSNNTLFLFNNSAGTISAFGDATEIEIGSSGILPGNFIVNNDRIIFTSEYTLQIPAGGTGTRGAPNIPGQIRFNTDLIQFEGYDGLAWGSLGGVKDIDGDTLILAELTPGSNDDTLFFITAGLQRMTLSTSALDIANTITSVTINGTTASTTTTNGQLVVAGGVGIGGNLNIGGSLGLTGSSTITGNLTVNGNTVLGNDRSADNVTLSGTTLINIPDNVATAFDVIEGTNSYIRATTTDSAEFVTFGTVPQIRINNTTESTSNTTGSLVVAGGVGVAKNLNVNGNLVVRESATIGDDVSVDTITLVGDYFHTIPDDRPVAYEIKEGTSVYFRLETSNNDEKAIFGTTPVVEIQNTTDSTDETDGALVVAGGAGIALNLNVGVDFTVGRDAVIEGDLEVRGGDLTTDQTTFNLLNSTATTVNAFGDATTINIGATTGTLTVNNEITVFDSVKAIKLPVGDDADRPTAEAGYVRFNTDLVQFEGYDGIAWNTLGGVRDVDGDTFIIAETAPGEDEDTLFFHTGGTLRMTLDTTDLDIKSSIDVAVKSTTASTSSTTGALVVSGGVGIGENLYVGGRIGGNLVINELSSQTLTINGDTVLIPNTVTLRTASDNTTQSSVLYPVTFEHRTSGTPAAGVGTGIQFRTQTGSATFKNGGAIDVVALDVTGNQEDFDMVFRTMVGGASASEKLRLSETLATFNADVRLHGDTISTSQTTFDLLDDTVTTLNFVGAATAISIGAATGTTTVNHNLTVDQTVTADELVLTNALEVQYGGTGVTTFTVNGILYGDAADPVKVTDAAGTSDINNSFQILTVTSEVDSTPVWTNTIDGGEY